MQTDVHHPTPHSGLFYPLAFGALLIANLYFLYSQTAFTDQRPAYFELEIVALAALLAAGAVVLWAGFFAARAAIIQYQKGLKRQKREENLTVLLNQISDGNLNFELPTGEDRLYGAVERLRQQLLSINEEDSFRNWQLEGVTIFTDLLRQNRDLKSLSQSFIEQLCRYVSAEQGALFLNDSGSVSPKAVLAAAYNARPEEQMQREIALGEGLTGQAIKEKRAVYLTNLPAGYVQIRSGLGQTSPAYMIIAPLLFEQNARGALELAFFNPVPERVVAFIEDIANRAAATIYTLQTAQQTEQLYQDARKQTESLRIRQRALDSSSNGFVISDNLSPDQPIIYVNAAFEKITGYKTEEIIGKNCRFLQKDDTNQTGLDELRAAINEQRETEVLLRNYRKDGSFFWNELRLTTVRDDNDRVTHFVGVQTDVTQRVQMDAEIRLLNESLEARVQERTGELESAMNELKDAQYRIIQTEKMASLGQLVAGVAHEINTPLAAIKASCENMIDFLPKITNELPDLLTRMKDDQRALFDELILHSQQKQEELSPREERELRKIVIAELEDYGIENANEVAKKLISNGLRDQFVHYLPLLVDPFADEIVKSAYNIAQLRQNLSIITQAADKTRKTVYALKRYSHTQADEKAQLVDLKDSIEVVLTLYHNQLKHGVKIITQFDNTIPPVEGYADELGQVWTNIIHNAAQAMAYDGTITIVQKQEDGYAVVIITDTGPGIPKEIINKIFDPFFTTKPQGEGTGLGLDICRKIVTDKHQGKLEVESRPGQTAFKVSLPFKLTIPASNS